jgi:antagonist of KipI
MTATVLRAGFLTTVQDLGRTGSRQSGVTLSGALDSHALSVANLLVGNQSGAAGLEATLGTIRLRFADERLIAWCGGEFDVHLAEAQIPPGRAARVHEGEELVVQPPSRGGRAWIAIAGGIDAPLVLGSRSTDLRSGFGGFDGRALADGYVLKLGRVAPDASRRTKSGGESRVASFGAPYEWAAPSALPGVLRVIRGVDWSRFEVRSQSLLMREAFQVRADSDRMGVRLSGPELTRVQQEDLVSEAVVPGTIQVPPSGQPILLLGDCQTIGGYPKIAHVITVDLPKAAQLCTGDQVRFAEVSLEEAQRLLIERERDLERFRIGLELRTR